MSKRRAPKSVGSILDEAPRSLAGLLARAGEAQALDDALRALLPDDVLPHVHAVVAEGDTLVVVAASSAWATRLRFLAPDLLARLARRDDLAVPPRIKVVVRVREEQRPSAPPPRPRALSRQAAAALEEGAASFAPGERLRHVLERLARRARRA